MDDNTNDQPGTPNVPEKRTDQAAAANVIRGDLERIYGGDEAPHAQAEKEIVAEQQSAAEDESRPDTKTEHTLHGQAPEVWKQYHTSWQSYYQQYYERYYLHHLQTAVSQQAVASSDGVIASDDPSRSKDDQAVAELRDKLLSHVKDRAQTVRKSRHFAPIFTALLFAVVFLFLQYNRFLFATVQAYVSPGNIDPQNIIIDPGASLKVGPEPKLIIPKINVDAPAVYDINPNDNNDVLGGLRAGVVHYPIPNASSTPGQNGATVILGHSSNDVFDSGAYKFVFVQLSKLEKGDTFYINYQGTRYTYSVSKKEIIDPTEVSKVTGDQTKPTAILITCEPPGTALKRLLVFADQISPDPAKSTAAPAKDKSAQTSNITGNAPTFIESLFGVR